MNCFDETETVITYIENNILSVNYEEISKLVGIPMGLYQRIFSYVCGISITEYIKRRRLTLAAEELFTGDNKVIDIALKYGYGSHASFTRAFKEQYGVAPTHISEEMIHKYLYPRLSFQNNEESYRMVKGRKLMAELERIEYVTLGERKIVGMERRANFYNAGEMWRDYFSTGAFDKVESLEEYICKDIDDYIGLGHMSQFDETGNEFTYVIGKFMRNEVLVPEGLGLSCYDIPEGIIAKARVRGVFQDIINEAYFLITEAVEKNGYRVDFDNLYWCDVYTYERYCKPKDRGDEILTLDYFMPCVKVDV